MRLYHNDLFNPKIFYRSRRKYVEHKNIESIEKVGDEKTWIKVLYLFFCLGRVIINGGLALHEAIHYLKQVASTTLSHRWSRKIVVMEAVRLMYWSVYVREERTYSYHLLNKRLTYKQKKDVNHWKRLTSFTFYRSSYFIKENKDGPALILSGQPYLLREEPQDCIIKQNKAPKIATLQNLFSFFILCLLFLFKIALLLFLCNNK